MSGWNPADHYVTAINDEFRNHAMSVAEWVENSKRWKTNDDNIAVNDACRSC
jgi:hypothetical protein